jgi:LEA14-like dessication related protein
MNAKLVQFKSWLLEKNHLLIVVIVALLLGMGATIYFQRNHINTLKNKVETEVKLKDALLDTMKIYKNKEGEWTAEKLTIQETIKNLSKMYGQLTESQRELMDRVKELNKKNDVIVAALIQANVKIDSLLSTGTPLIDTVNKNIIFPEVKNPDLQYHIQARNVVPAFPNIKPSLFIIDLTMPNKSFVSFQFDKTKGNPVSFSVSNSNKYFQIANIESYAIPGINKDIVQPTGWQKTWGWMKKNGTIIIVGVGGVVAGHYLLK